MERNTRTVPFHVAVLLFIVAGSSITFAVANALTEYAFIKPYVANIIMMEPNVKIEGFTLNFDAPNLIYASVSVNVKNYGSASATATIYAYLYDAANTNIASGASSITVGAGNTASVTVALSWSTGKNATQVASGRVIVKEQ